jgi:hypothetical protein
VLLSVITFMAVTFLVVSRSQHGSVATETDQAIARLGADTARERAIAQLLAPIMAWTNEFNYGLLASTNYIRPGGFVSGGSGPLNVSYNYANGAPLNLNDSLQNLTNLLYDPRPPVFIVTNALGSNDFRFYLDLNRNRRYDPSGLQPVINAQGGFYDLSGNPVPYQWPPPPNILSNFFVGDPEWIGALQHPEFAHSADNRFVYRYAYLAVPAGQTLDLNCIHNQALRPTKTKLDPQGGDFRRDQGVGTFEINLASFLYDLNTNLYAWGGLYRYNPVGNFQPAGNAFADAGALLAYRYAMNPNSYAFTLASVDQLFGGAGHSAFGRDFLDGYSTGLMLNPSGFSVDPDSSPINCTRYPWAGAENPNRFYTTQDLFDKTKTALGLGKTYSFTDRLLAAGANTNSYDRYTFYRLLSQLGTDSAPEPGGKMNLNYCNVDANGYVVPNMATNFIPWTNAVQFFTNAAIRLLADAGYTVGPPSSTSNLLVFGSNYVNNFWITTTNLRIPLWPTNYYTPSVHRLFQLAANIYDATTNRNFNVATATSGFPTVFRPIFLNGAGKGGGGIFINGFQEVTDASLVQYTTPMRDLQLLNDRTQLKPNDMICGQPLVIGAKKGFPNFNQFSMETVFQITRKLQFLRLPPNANPAITPVKQTNQMFLVGISNRIGVEAWNSYSSAYPRGLQMSAYVNLNTSLFMTNAPGSVIDLLNTSLSPSANPNLPRSNSLAINGNTWIGFTNPNYVQVSFQIPSHPSINNRFFLTNSQYYSSSFPPHFELIRTPPPVKFENPSYFPNPAWMLSLRTRLLFSLVDTNVTPPRIVDYVNLDHTDDVLDIATNLMWHGEYVHDYLPPLSPPWRLPPLPPPPPWPLADGAPGSMWITNRGVYAIGSQTNQIKTNQITDVRVPTRGVYNQIWASFFGPPGVSPQPLKNLRWNSYSGDAPPGFDVPGSVNFFRTNLCYCNSIPGMPYQGHLYLTNEFYSPYAPTRSIHLFTSWQASDPLVHYTVADLNLVPTNQVSLDDDPPSPPIPPFGLDVNQRYNPWGYPLGNPTPPNNLTVKDPLATRSDAWDFPTNKLPNVGWLGRVHRGTPWQTVYLKSPGADLPTWRNWTGNGRLVTNLGQFSTNMVLPSSVVYYPVLTNPPPTITFSNGLAVYDAYFTEPTNDWRLLDLFTTALSDSATRGQLSINQTDLAAWSAVLSGVCVLTNSLDGSGKPFLAPQIIQPAGVYSRLDPTTWPPIVQLLKSISDTRATNGFPGQVFHRLSDILSVPALTVASPFLNRDILPADPNYVLNDAAVERLPQQILGLLKCDHTPRFVIYAFGQTLKPAAHAIVPSGPFAGLCTNYQIMAEAATRTVIRFEGVQPCPAGTLPPPITRLHPVIESFNVLPPD